MNLWGGTVHFNKTGVFLTFTITMIVFMYLFSNNSNNIKKDNVRSNRINLKELLKRAITAAQKGGMEVVQATKKDLIVSSKGKTKEGLEDSFTNADLKSHCQMITTLQSSFPDMLVVSEEKMVQCDTPKDVNNTSFETEEVKSLRDYFVDNNDVTVWIDPLDATYEYKEKLYQYVTTMVCVAVHGEPVIGVICDPFTGKISWAWVGAGMSSDLKKIDQANTSKKIVVTVSRSHAGKVKEVLKKKFENDLEIKIAAGAGYKVLQLVKGQADAYVHLTAIKKWDICAGNAILNALGGKMVSLDNSKINYADVKNAVHENGLVATLQIQKVFIEKLSSL